MLLSDLSGTINPVWGFVLLGYVQAAIAAAPFVAKYGPKALGFLKNIFKGKDLLSAAGKIGEIAGAAGGAAKQGRLEESLQQATIDRQNALMQRQASEFNLGAPSIRASQAARGDLLANVQPVVGTGSGRDYRVTGGLDPSVFGPNTRQAGSLLSSQALQALQSGSDRLSPTMSSIPKSGMLERFLGGAGTIGGLLGAVGQASDRLRIPSNLPSSQTGGVEPAMRNQGTGTIPPPEFEEAPDVGIFSQLPFWNRPGRRKA
jgi:hypothetical protein